jgi:hypothetical protein
MRELNSVVAGAAFAAAFFVGDPATAANDADEAVEQGALLGNNNSVYFPGCTALNMNQTSGMPLVPASSPHFFQNVWLSPDVPAGPNPPPQIITLGKLSAAPIGMVELYLGGPSGLTPGLTLRGAGINQISSWYLNDEVPADGHWHMLTVAANTNLNEAEAAIDYPINPLTSMIPLTQSIPGGFQIATGEIGDWGLFGPYGMAACGQPSGTYYKGMAAENVADFVTRLGELAARLQAIVVNTANGLRALGIPITDPTPSILSRGDQDWFAHGPDPGYIAMVVGPHGFKNLRPGDPVLGDPCQSSPLTVIGCK